MISEFLKDLLESLQPEFAAVRPQRQQEELPQPAAQQESSPPEDEVPEVSDGQAATKGGKIVDDPRNLVIYSEIMRPKFDL